jgi:hypothetical protein
LPFAETRPVLSTSGRIGRSEPRLLEPAKHSALCMRELVRGAVRLARPRGVAVHGQTTAFKNQRFLTIAQMAEASTYPARLMARREDWLNRVSTGISCGRHTSMPPKKAEAECLGLGGNSVAVRATLRVAIRRDYDRNGCKSHLHLICQTNHEP